MRPLYKGEQHKTNAHNIFILFPRETSKGSNFSYVLQPFLISKMVMTISGGSNRRRLVKGSFNSKGKTFDQELAMDPIDMEPLSLALPTTLVSYGTGRCPYISHFKEQHPSSIKKSPND